jgi:hypothetical protein
MMKTFFVGLLFVIATSSTAWSRQDAQVDDNDIKVAHFEPLDYPFAANLNEDVTVVVKLALDSDGKVVNATAVSGAKYFTSASIENAKKWVFLPNAQKTVILIYIYHHEAAFCASEETWFEYVRPNIVNIRECSGPPRY